MTQQLIHRVRPSHPYIALCGNPKAGKSEVQKIINSLWSFTGVDDGRVLRDNAKRMFGLTEEQVSTQEGKDSYVQVCGHSWQVRQILGDLGQLYEDHFGEDVIPEMAIRDANDLAFTMNTLTQPVFTFGSVRKNQGLVYKRHGGLVVEVYAPDAKESHYAFDKYNKEAVDVTIFNKKTSLFDLTLEIVKKLGPVLGAELVGS